MLILLPLSEEVNLYISSDECVEAVMSSVWSFFWELMTGETIWSFLEPLVLDYYRFREGLH